MVDIGITKEFIKTEFGPVPFVGRHFMAPDTCGDEKCSESNCQSATSFTSRNMTMIYRQALLLADFLETMTSMKISKVTCHLLLEK